MSLEKVSLRNRSSKNGETPSPADGEILEPIETVQSLRLDLSKLKQTAKKLLTVVPVKRPQKEEFIRVHPDEENRLLCALISLEQGKEIYLVHPTFLEEVEPDLYSLSTLFLTVNRSGVVFLWPVVVPGQHGKVNPWHLSAVEAAEMAMERWVRVSSNQTLGAYEIHEAISQIGDPKWPDASFDEILNIAFRGRIIRSHDHPVMKKLRGELI